MNCFYIILDYFLESHKDIYFVHNLGVEQSIKVRFLVFHLEIEEMGTYSRISPHFIHLPLSVSLY